MVSVLVGEYYHDFPQREENEFWLLKNDSIQMSISVIYSFSGNEDADIRNSCQKVLSALEKPGM